MAQDEVLVVGGGVIGVSCAWRLAQAGYVTTVIDPAPGAGATWTAAGMLTPVTEYGYGEQDLLRLNLEAARLYPEFVAELERDTGAQVGYQRSGTLQVAWDSADLATLRDVNAQHSELGLAAELLSGRELRRREPALASGLPGALWAPDDHQVDNRALHRALLTAATAAGVGWVAAPVAKIEITDTGVRGVRLADGQVRAASTVVVAAGAHCRQLRGLPDELSRAVRAVKGQTLRLRSPDASALLRHVIRGSVKGVPVYLVPRANREMVVGASSEDAGFDVRPRAGAIYDLLRDAFALVPALAEWTWDEVSTGLRPGTPDNRPLIGATSVPGLVMATGHYRNGVLLAPLTAQAVVAAVAGRPINDVVAACAPDRFAAVPA